MSLYVQLDTCPCGRCATSWGRGACYHEHYKALIQPPRYSTGKPRVMPANFAEIEAISLLWRHRADADDGYAREDEVEWYQTALGRLPTERELAGWGRLPIDWSQLTDEEILSIVALAGENPCSQRAARNAAAAYERRLTEGNVTSTDDSS